MTDRHLEPRSGNPSQNSRLRAATDIQSSVSPEDYPAEDRRMQTLGAISGAPANASGGDKPGEPAPPTAPTTPGKAEGDDDTSPPQKGSPKA